MQAEEVELVKDIHSGPQVGQGQSAPATTAS